MSSFDQTHVWHPYTSMTDPLPTWEVRSAHGVRIKLADGRELIDGMSSWWSAIHGYNHPVLNEAATHQLSRMAHVMFGGFRHAPATELAKLLVDITPAPLQYVFFSDSGSVSVEVAIKMAIQYWHNLGQPQKHRLLALRGGYHGDTFAAMSVGDPVDGMHALFGDALPKQLFAPRPQARFGAPADPADLASLRTLLEQHHAEIAALILEPIVQAAGGMWFYSVDYLQRAHELCREFNVLLIADEIAMGFGRTGKLFACEHAGIEPDILCLGKGLTGGYVGLAATLTNDRVRDGISANGGMLMHGPTFMANPLACAIAGASVRLLLEGNWQQRIAAIERQLAQELESCRRHPAVADVRVLGAIGVVECRNTIDVAKLQQRFVERGVWLRPFGTLLYVMPPYIIAAAELRQLTAAMHAALDEL